MCFKLKFIVFVLLFSSNIFSQNNSPRKAALLSMACPGLGQVYNKKYWKAPIVITSIGGAIYAHNFYNNKFKEYKEAYIIRTDGDESTIDNYLNYSENGLITLQDYYRNQKDLSIIIGTIIYLLNIADAYVDAHLFEYNVNDNLSFDFKPYFNYQNNNLQLISLKLKLKE
tara:strand:+ start:112 stop:621 length:510 start_codon:yes stop_codon:yes gene_type:complete